MKVIEARNVAEALPLGLAYLLTEGTLADSRAGRVIVAPGPVTTVYEHPSERVLFSAKRDANPFFHLMEAMWLLAGRDDTGFLDHYVRDFGKRFAENVVGEPAQLNYLHGSYGARWRTHFGYDQLAFVVKKLKDDPASRQCIIQMWDPTDNAQCGANDLRGDFRDRPCNTSVFVRMRRGELDMLVSCRSNDIIMGAYGANAVQFSFLQEYLAGMLNTPVGKYWQVSWDFHAYVRDADKLIAKVGGRPMKTWGAIDVPSHALAIGLGLKDNRYGTNGYAPLPKLIRNPETFDRELLQLMHLIDWAHRDGPDEVMAKSDAYFENYYLMETVFATAASHEYFRRRNYKAAIDTASTIAGLDWRWACQEWLFRRTKNLTTDNAHEKA